MLDRNESSGALVRADEIGLSITVRSFKVVVPTVEPFLHELAG